MLKFAKVFPIFKGGTKSDPSNYRPFSILPTVHVSKSFEKHKVFHESQSGFRQKHSYQTALIQLVDHLMTCIDNGDIVGTFFVDFLLWFYFVCGSYCGNPDLVTSVNPEKQAVNRRLFRPWGTDWVPQLLWAQSDCHLVRRGWFAEKHFVSLRCLLMGLVCERPIFALLRMLVCNATEKWVSRI